ncbi:mariner Mos1 transposase [Trichonephila clavipes]|nr:mariner Mos1 transposase [Trichonephila clavipes]
MRRKSCGYPVHASTSKAKPNIHGSKVILSIWWDQLGVVYYELLKPTETITCDRYRTQSMRLSRALKDKRPQYNERHDKNRVVFSGVERRGNRNRWRDGQVCPELDKELWRLGPDGPGVFWRRKEETRERSPALDGEKGKALPWMEKREKPCPGWIKHERRFLVGTDGKRALKKRAYSEIGVERR